MNVVSIVIGIAGAGLVLLFIRLSMLEQRLNRLSRLDAKVDALLKHAGIHFDPFRDVPADVREALERGEPSLPLHVFERRPVPASMKPRRLSMKCGAVAQTAWRASSSDGTQRP